MTDKSMVGMSVTADARAALRTIASVATGLVERQVTLSEALIAAAQVAGSHRDELKAELLEDAE
jgi:hypothetical protein